MLTIVARDALAVSGASRPCAPAPRRAQPPPTACAAHSAANLGHLQPQEHIKQIQPLPK